LVFAASQANPVAGLVLQAANAYALINNIVALKPRQLDAEASVYAGVATLAHMALLEINPVGVDLTLRETVRATADALGNIRRGLTRLDAEDRRELNEWVEDLPYNTTVQLGAFDLLI
jgi:hypothetical protein